MEKKRIVILLTAFVLYLLVSVPVSRADYLSGTLPESFYCALEYAMSYGQPVKEGGSEYVCAAPNGKGSITVAFVSGDTSAIRYITIKSCNGGKCRLVWFSRDSKPTMYGWMEKGSGKPAKSITPAEANQLALRYLDELGVRCKVNNYK